ncbi:MAG: acetyltransferase, family [Myxococcaceae bacterium]|nr:acetyltransferase, family [Myxococcaceae bacterium]
MIEYRDGHPVELEALAALREACGFKDQGPGVLEAQLSGARYAAAAYDAGRLVGFARALSDGVTSGYISSVMVAAEHRRRGIGRELIGQLVRGREHIRWVLHARQGAAEFYRALGFQPSPDLLWRDRR